jgi:preprotein translocase subunit SecE
VAKTKATKKSKGGNAVMRYLRDTRAELRKVRWPTRQEAWSLTKIVLAVTISMALVLGLLDYLFSLELRGLVDQTPQAQTAHVVAIVIAVIILVGSIAAFVVANLRRAQ